MPNHFSTLKSDFLHGRISKPEFISKAHDQFHSILFQLSSELPNTDIASIELTDNKVCMVSREDNIRIIVDCLDYRTAPIEILNFNAYEPELTSTIRKLAPCMNTMLDIGANIGWYTLLVSQINSHAVIHAFEPIPTTFRSLNENIAVNNATNVCAHNFGLSSRPGSFPFFFYPQGGVNASLQNLSDREDATVIECTLSTLDEFACSLKINTSIDFIKCDVEGNELFVLQGGMSTIDKHKPIILLELLRKWSARFDYHPNEVIELLRSSGYSTFVCSPSEAFIPIERITEETVETNFFFVHPQSVLRDKLIFDDHTY